MTSNVWLMLAALVLPGFENEPRSAAGVPSARHEADAPFSSLHEAREAVTRVMRASHKSHGRESRETAPAVISTLDRLARSENLPLTERRKLQSRLRARLSEQLKTLRRHEQPDETSHSGGVAADARELINLIQTTIAPESWEINGGLGTIYYFPNG